MFEANLGVAAGNLDGALTLKPGPRCIHAVDSSSCTTNYGCLALANVFRALPKLVTEGNCSPLKGFLWTYPILKQIAFREDNESSLTRPSSALQVTVRIGRPITGYGSESRNRAARQRIRHNITKDEDGEEHVQVSNDVEMLAVNFLLLGKGVSLRVCCSSILKRRSSGALSEAVRDG